MNSLSIQIRYGWASSFTNRTWNSLSARVMSGATVLAANDSGGDVRNGRVKYHEHEPGEQ
jgi:hypothetical protein